ncbi:MAG: VanZ family protein [Brevundimonas sp.]|uniref:VanZ family protein n=1 Tax=Brevundimonas sp. TaxID=1871086 RepID=UPI00271CA7EE|nr:VanZ family protein [Brevundimonas sp.]MDO9079148.1 VanZ family protein [Brevundimonas sp.]MDP3081677.1 VanZ family protein [Brevundimonas sp.]MDZ4060604.1 VanZ family protein [Brevundimonas sp.]
MRLFLRLAGALVLLVLVALMLAPGGTIEAETLIWDKAAHFIAFGLILWSLGVLFRRLPRTWAALLAVALGAAVEVVQRYVGRDPSWGDLLADVLGVATALLIWLVWRGFRPRQAFQTSNT